MTGEMFLIILAGILIIGIIFIFIFQTYNFISLTNYTNCWKPIYENRKLHFDVYLKEALEHSNSADSIYRIAKLAAKHRLEEEYNELKGYELEEFELHYDSKLENYTYEYEHELRCAGFE